MLILDKARALDLMIARSEQVVVPEPYTATAGTRQLAVYAPATPPLPALVPETMLAPLPASAA